MSLNRNLHTIRLIGPTYLPLDLIERALPDWDDEDLEDVLNGELRHRNLVQFVSAETAETIEGEGTYQLHQLLREFMGEKLTTELAGQTSALQKGIARAWTTMAQQIPQTVTLTVLADVQEAMPHMALVAGQYSPLIEDSSDATWPYIGLARFYRGQSFWPEAEHWYQSCLDMTEKRFGPDHPDTALSVNNLAGLYDSMGRYSEAEPLYERSLAIWEKQLGPDHSDTALSLHNFAFFCASRERYLEAEKLYVRAIESWLKTLGLDYPNTQTGVRNFVSLLQQMLRRWTSGAIV